MTEAMKKKIEQGREYRSLILEIKEDDSDYIVEGYATTYEEPYHLYDLEEGKEVREVVLKTAFDNTDMSDVIMQYDHEGRVFARLSNDTLKLASDDHGLKTTAYLGGTEIGRNLYEEIKGGYTNKMSFGFTVDDSDVIATDYGYLRTIRSIRKLYDVSAVSLPANDYTEISARSRIDGVIDEIEAERTRLEEIERVKAEKRESLMKRLNALKGANDGN